uniref:AAA+ ATPase domain-containing protein n=1 Tax=Eutreptiella gymnastica TaxID=73025 RepID=A0A7S4G498_9EUGL
MAARMAAFREDRAPKPKKFKPNSAESKKRKQDFDLIVSEKQKKAIPEEYTAQAAARTAKNLEAIVREDEEKKKRDAEAAAATNPKAIDPNAPSGTDKAKGGKARDKVSNEDEQPAMEISACATSERYTDFGGLKKELDEIRRLIEFPLRYPQVFDHLGADPPSGVLLHGPPGCGKTKLAHAVAGELQLPFYKISAPEVVAGVSGESEQKIRLFFKTAMAQAPCIMFIDEIDAIAGKRESAGKEMERRIVAQMLSCMDEIPVLWRDHRKICIVMGATNRPDAIDSALRRAGRFDREIHMSIPTYEGRIEILQVLTQKLKLEGELDLKSIAFRTPGFVGADLHALTKEASAIALQRIFNLIVDNAAADAAASAAEPENDAAEKKAEEKADEKPSGADEECVFPAPPPARMPPPKIRSSSPPLSVDKPDAGFDLDDPAGAADDPPEGPLEPAAPVPEAIAPPSSSQPFALPVVEIGPEILEKCSIMMADFDEAVTLVQPSTMREGFTTVPSVTWDDVGALEDVKVELINNISKPILRPDVFKAMGCLDNPIGVMLYGPPGCGKTLVAKAIANESGANFISIKGPELLNKFLGETEKSVRTVFARAQSSAPCILFFDELDALAPKRGNESGNAAAERVVNQLLTELDGVKGRNQVYVIGASNRLDMIDPAMLRPGRLDKLLFVPLPNAAQRITILQKQARNAPLDGDVDLGTYGSDKRCDGFSGADCAALVREAAVAAVTEFFDSMQDDDDARDTTRDPPTVGVRHFETALQKVKPSVSVKDRTRYEQMRSGMSAVPRS